MGVTLKYFLKIRIVPKLRLNWVDFVRKRIQNWIKQIWVQNWVQNWAQTGLELNQKWEKLTLKWAKTESNLKVLCIFNKMTFFFVNLTPELLTLPWNFEKLSSAFFKRAALGLEIAQRGMQIMVSIFRYLIAFQQSA